jgi:hypothetical protein
MSYQPNHLPPPLRSAMRHTTDPLSPTPSSASALPTVGSPPSSNHLASPPPSLRKLPKATTTSSFSTPLGYTPKVGFDTFENTIDDAMFSFTLQVKKYLDLDGQDTDGSDRSSPMAIRGRERHAYSFVRLVQMRLVKRL